VYSFLNTKIKDVKQDPDRRWITTWNHYINRTKLFYRWFYNAYKEGKNYVAESPDPEEWITPDFVKIIKRLAIGSAHIVKQRFGSLKNYSQ
jgi:integrase/recombinase XerD